MTKKEQIEMLAAKAEVSKKQATLMLDAMVEMITSTVKKGGELRVSGLGTFKSSHRKAREGVNPLKPTEKLKIPAMDVPAFKASSVFKKLLRK